MMRATLRAVCIWAAVPAVDSLWGNLSLGQAARDALTRSDAVRWGPRPELSNSSRRCYADAWDAAPASRIVFGGRSELRTRKGIRARAARVQTRFEDVAVSVVTTVYGGAMDRDFAAYARALASSLRATAWELVVVLDVPEAGWVERVLSQAAAPAVATAAWACEALFEPAADMIGLALSTAPLVVLAQVDTRLAVSGWLAALRRPVDAWDDVIAVSGRDAHQWWSRDACGGPRGDDYFRDPSKHSRKVCTVRGEKLAGDIFVVRDTANRGPLLLRKRYVDALGGLDDECFYNGGDEHDLFARAYIERGWVVGAVNVGPFRHVKETRPQFVHHNFDERAVPLRGCDPSLAVRLAPLELPSHNEVRHFPT